MVIKADRFEEPETPNEACSILNLQPLSKLFHNEQILEFENYENEDLDLLEVHNT